MKAVYRVPEKKLVATPPGPNRKFRQEQTGKVWRLALTENHFGIPAGVLLKKTSGFSRVFVRQ